MKKQQAIEKVSRPTSLATSEQVPEYLRHEGAPRGLEHMDRQDMTLPRLGLCQSMTPQRKKSDPKYIPGLEEGQFFNTITREIYGEQVKLVPLLFYKSRIRFGPMEEGGGMRCQAPDARAGQGDPGGDCTRCPLQLFGPKGERPECNIFYNYPALVVGRDGRVVAENLIVVSFKSTGLKAARDFNALVRLRGVDMFAGIYELSSVEAKNDRGAWYQPVIQPAGWVSRETLAGAQQAYAAMSELARAGRLRVDMEDLNPAAGGATSEEM